MIAASYPLASPYVSRLLANLDTRESITPPATAQRRERPHIYGEMVSCIVATCDSMRWGFDSPWMYSLFLSSACIVACWRLVLLDERDRVGRVEEGWRDETEIRRRTLIAGSEYRFLEFGTKQTHGVEVSTRSTDVQPLSTLRFGVPGAR